jgi:hypothetical protein
MQKLFQCKWESSSLDVLQFTLYLHSIFDSRDSSFSKVTNYGLIDQVSIYEKGSNFPFAVTSKPALGLIQSHIKWLPGSLSQRV